MLSARLVSLMMPTSERKSSQGLLWLGCEMAELTWMEICRLDGSQSRDFLSVRSMIIVCAITRMSLSFARTASSS